MAGTYRGTAELAADAPRLPQLRGTQTARVRGMTITVAGMRGKIGPDGTRDPGAQPVRHRQRRHGRPDGQARPLQLPLHAEQRRNAVGVREAAPLVAIGGGCRLLCHGPRAFGLDPRGSASTSDPCRTHSSPPEEPTAAEAIAAVEGDLDLFDDWMDRYGFIIDLGRKLPPFPEEWQDDAHRVPGCQSKVWMEATMRDGRLFLAGASDAAIVSGLVALLLRVYSGRAAGRDPRHLARVPEGHGPARQPLQQSRQRHRLDGRAHPRRRPGGPADRMPL